MAAWASSDGGGGTAPGKEGGPEEGKSPVADFHWHPAVWVLSVGRGGGRPEMDGGEAAPTVGLLAIAQSPLSTDSCSVVLTLQTSCNTSISLERC